MLRLNYNNMHVKPRLPFLRLVSLAHFCNASKCNFYFYQNILTGTVIYTYSCGGKCEEIYKLVCCVAHRYIHTYIHRYVCILSASFSDKLSRLYNFSPEWFHIIQFFWLFLSALQSLYHTCQFPFISSYNFSTQTVKKSELISHK